MKLKNEPGMINEEDKAPSTCESCGNEFKCGANLDVCWCMNLKLTDEARAEIKSKFNDCLCQTCLEKHTSKELI